MRTKPPTTEQQQQENPSKPKSNKLLLTEQIFVQCCGFHLKQT